MPNYPLAALFVVTAALFYGACDAAPTRRSAQLPNLPPLAGDEIRPAIREQLQKAYNDARKYPTSPVANGRLGMVLHAYKQYEAAEACYERAHLLDQSDFRWAYYLGTVRFFLGKDADAATSLRRAIELDPHYAPALLRLAGVLLDADELDESREIYETLVRRDPDLALAHYGLGRVASARRDAAAALDYYREACRLSEKFGAAQYSLALAYRDLADTEKSEKHFALYRKHRLAEQPLKDPVLHAVSEQNTAAAREHFNRGLRLARADHLPAAVKAFEQALEIDPGVAEVHSALISLYARLGQFAKAEKQYRAAVETDPENAEVHYNFGVLMARQQKLPQAEEAFQKALEADPSFAEARSSLALMLEPQGRLQEAATHHRLAIENNPDYRPAHFHLGRILLTQGRNDEAFERFRVALAAQDAQTPSLMFDVALVLGRAGFRQKAVDLARQANQRATSLGQTELASVSGRLLRDLESTGR